MKRANPITRGVLFLMGNERRQRITIPVFAILLSLIASSIVLLILGKDPIEAFISLLRGSGILPKEAYGAKKEYAHRLPQPAQRLDAHALCLPLRGGGHAGGTV